MKKIIAAALLLVGMSGVSCSFLDTEPYDVVTPDNYYNTEGELQMSLNGVYAIMANTTLFGGDYLARMGLDADIGYESYSSDYGTVGDYDVSPSDAKILNFWRDLYTGIDRANQLMEHINDAEGVSQRSRDNIYAQALFLRAYYHFLLVVRFNRIPLILHATTDSKASNVQIAQSEPREVYLRIIEDMEEAADYLYEASELQSPGRVSRSTAYGMLARVALYMAGYPVYEAGMYARAKDYAQKVMDTGYHRLNPSYREFFLNLIQDRYDPQESLFEVEFYGNNEGTYTTTAGRVGRDNGIGCSNNTNVFADGLTLVDKYGYSIGATRCTPYYYEMFGEGDLRRDWTIADYTYNTTTGEKTYQTTNIWTRYCGKFRREYEVGPRSTNYTPINFPLLRYSDVLLMWAEAVAADPDNNDAVELAQAYEYVNQVRRRGYGYEVSMSNPLCDLETGDKMMLLEDIKEERARELGYECLRKDDILRWGQFYDQMRLMRTYTATILDSYTSSYYINAKRYYKNASSRDEFWPIPSYEMGVNRQLVQNPGW